jgi:ATP-dependent DNA helicase DinG
LRWRWRGGTRVLISTATVALQEQLVNKDLPALAAQMPQPFKFALAKGRGRYVCKLKLDRLAGTGEAHGEDDDDLFPEESRQRPRKRSHQETEARMQFYSTMAQTLAKGAWDGDRDSLDTPPEPEVWSPVAAEGVRAPASTARPSASAPITTSARSWWARR